MDRPSSPPTPPQHSNVVTYAVVALVLLGAGGFFFLIFGELFVVALAVFLVIGAVAGMHYVLWGRAMDEQAKDEREGKAE